MTFPALIWGDYMKQAIGKRCKVMKLLCHDLTGPTVEFLAKAAGIEPLVDTSRLHLVDAEYQRRIDAMEYTLNHDDGLGIATLAEADVVLVGVSRVSKTPTGILLAQRGLRAANVALAMEVEPPAELLAMPPKKVIGLTIEPVQLAEIRSRRQEEWGMQTTRYNERQHVAREVAWARKLFAQHRWRTLDVTDQAVEETAARIVQLLEGSES